jgi:NADPH:quinone reductase-like Zn-dependent oxidoreductase
MKAIRIHEYGGASALKLEEVPRVSISDDEILAQVHNAGVNPIDWKIRFSLLPFSRLTNRPQTEPEFELVRW